MKKIIWRLQHFEICITTLRLNYANQLISPGPDWLIRTDMGRGVVRKREPSLGQMSRKLKTARRKILEGLFFGAWLFNPVLAVSVSSSYFWVVWLRWQNHCYELKHEKTAAQTVSEIHLFFHQEVKFDLYDGIFSNLIKSQCTAWEKSTESSSLYCFSSLLSHIFLNYCLGDIKGRDLTWTHLIRQQYPDCCGERRAVFPTRSPLQITLSLWRELWIRKDLIWLTFESSHTIGAITAHLPIYKLHTREKTGVPWWKPLSTGRTWKLGKSTLQPQILKWGPN